LLGIDCVVIPLGLFIFHSVEKRTKSRGTLSEY
jgi:hypothetical protein